jgi:peroxiredoxin
MCSSGLLAILLFWFAGGISHAQGAGSELFRALNLVHFSDAVELPELDLPDLDGREVPLRTFRGKVLMINFWTTWWPYCERERSALEALYKRYKKRGLEILAVNMGESAAQVKAYVARHGLSFPHVLDADYKVTSMFSVRGTPANFFVDRQGRILGGGAGYRDWTTPDAHRLIESLL